MAQVQRALAQLEQVAAFPAPQVQAAAVGQLVRTCAASSGGDAAAVPWADLLSSASWVRSTGSGGCMCALHTLVSDLCSKMLAD